MIMTQDELMQEMDERTKQLEAEYEGATPRRQTEIETELQAIYEVAVSIDFGLEL